jgi:putative spermidine/putrescine transport system ATP-binding protein
MKSETLFALELDTVSKRYGDLTAARDVNLTVGKRELVTLLGPSGCGKTTILRLIAGFARPNSGTVRINGAVVNDVPPHRRRVGLVFQNYALFPHLTVGENVAFGLKMRRVASKARRASVNQALDRVRLTDRINAYPWQLSGGQQQRVALARALVIEPDVLLLDEPFGALDRELRQHMQGELRRLQRSYGISTLLVTHDQEEALMLSDRIVVMNAGAVEQTGTGADVFERPQTRFVARFMGRMNLFDGHVRSAGEVSEVELAGNAAEIALRGRYRHGDKVTVMIRPERIVMRLAVAPIGVTDDCAAGPLLGKITEVNYLGATVETTVAIGEGNSTTLLMRALASPDGAMNLAPGDLVRVTIPHEAVHVIASRVISTEALQAAAPAPAD